MSFEVLSDAYIMTVHSLRLDYLDCLPPPICIKASIVALTDRFRLVTPLLSLFLPDPVTKLSISHGSLRQALLPSHPSADLLSVIPREYYEVKMLTPSMLKQSNIMRVKLLFFTNTTE